MPFNGIAPEKVTLLFLQLLKIKQGRDKEEDRISFIESKQNSLIADNRLEDNESTRVRKIKYTPGLLLISNTQEGYILGHIDFAFLAALTYVIGSVCYMISSVLNWYEESYGYSPDSIFNLLAAIFFIINVVFCFIDWYMQRKLILTFQRAEAKYNKDGILVSKDGTVMLDDNSLSWSSSLKINMLYFWNNVYFFLAAVVYTFQGIALLNYTIISFCNTDTFCNNFYMNLFGSLFYVISGYYSLREYIFTRQIRDDENLPQLPLFSGPLWDLDWFGWGNICYMPAGITAFIQSFTSNLGVHNNDDDNAYNFVYLLGNWFFTVNSIQYFIGYMIFVFKMKKALEESLAEVETIRVNGVNDTTIPETAANTVKNLCNDPRQSTKMVERISEARCGGRISLSETGFGGRLPFEETGNRVNIQIIDERLSTRETVVKNAIHHFSSQNQKTATATTATTTTTATTS